MGKIKSLYSNSNPRYNVSMSEERIETTEQLAAIVNKITIDGALFKTLKFKFNITTFEKYGWFISLAFERPDVETGKIEWGEGRKEFIPIGSYESFIVKTCWLLFELLVRHEIMEGFCWNGKRIFNPHNSVQDLAKIQ